MRGGEPDERSTGSPDDADIKPTGEVAAAPPSSPGPRTGISRGRWILVNVLIGVTTLLLASKGNAANSIPEQLQQLAELRDHGAISADEYQAAKAQLLHT
jgi:hypothetical protein